MPTDGQLDLALLPGARALLAVHRRELPQRDDLCGAFCGALALRAAGIERHGGTSLDQDDVALAAGTVVGALTAPGTLPQGERGRRDYRLPVPVIDDSTLAGTTAAGLVAAIAELSAGELEAIPYSGPWTPLTLGALFEVALGLQRPVTLMANLATRQLWGANASLQVLLDYLFDGRRSGPAPDWDVGHFACLVSRARGPGGCLYGVADTYPSLGSAGVHQQPQERLALALERPDMPPGGLIVVADRRDAAKVRAGADAGGLSEGLWDNGTAVRENPT